MKLSFLAILLALGASLSALADDPTPPCIKPGAKVKVYGAIDTVHFFHGGNGMHVADLTVHTYDSFCVEKDVNEGQNRYYNFQLVWDDERHVKLTDGMLVDLEGVYDGFGDTAWYTSYPLMRNAKVLKVYKTDPHEVR